MNVTSSIKSSTVNTEEMSKFKLLSSIWWNAKGDAAFIHTMNEKRVPWIMNVAKEVGLIDKNKINHAKPLEGITALDAGCGTGVLTESLAELGCSIVGIDPCPEMIYEARKHQSLNSSLSNITYIAGTIEEHAEHNQEKYDMVFALEVIDHVDNPDLFLELCCKCLKPGGTIFVTTFTKTWISWFLGIICAEYITRLLPIGSHSYSKFITPEDTKKILLKCK